MGGNAFLKLQNLGSALMLPITVLPVAGILLRLGQPDVLNIKLIANAGSAVFDNLPLLFALGVAVGFAKDNNGVAALAGAIGYLIEMAVMKSIHSTLDMGVLSGIIAGVVAGALYNRYKDIKLPDYLAFFGGKRFVPIITGLVCVVLGIIFGYIWPPVQAVLGMVGHWLITAGALGVFVFGFLNRLLLVTGLHHILNSLAWFVFGSYTSPAGVVVTGDLHRFFAGDPSAGSFMAGFFPIMMFGLPAACIAMFHAAQGTRRMIVGGLLLSMALTSCLTGVTEPIEFSFMFLAPALYVAHAALTGLSLAICQLLGVKLGFTFSAGAIDYVLNYGLSTKGWYVLPLGAVYGGVYYGLFRFFISRFNLATPGRESAMSNPVPASSISLTTGVAVSRAQRYITALGGVENFSEVNACMTRLRLVVVDPDKVLEAELKTIGARGVLKRHDGSVQVIIGPEADAIADEMRAALSGVTAMAVAAPSVTRMVAKGPVSLDAKLVDWPTAFGGVDNITALDVVAMTRLRVVVRDVTVVDRQRLAEFDVAQVADDIFHVICGLQAQHYALQSSARLTFPMAAAG